MRHATFTGALAIGLALAAVPCAQAQEGAIFENEGGLNFETADGNFTFGILGRIQADAAFYDQDVAALGSGTEFRRARIGAQGTFIRTGDSRPNWTSLTKAWHWRMSTFNTSASIR